MLTQIRKLTQEILNTATKVFIKMKRLSFNSQTLLIFSLSNAKEGILESAVEAYRRSMMRLSFAEYNLAMNFSQYRLSNLHTAILIRSTQL